MSLQLIIAEGKIAKAYNRTGELKITVWCSIKINEQNKSSRYFHMISS